MKTIKEQKKILNKRGIISWAFFDWANSAFSTIVFTFVFATYFTEKIAVNKIIGTSQWGDAIALASLIIAISSPILGAIADYKGRRKPWIAAFSFLCITSSALLWYAKPDASYILWTLSFVILGTIGLEVSMVFYNALLKDITPPKYLGRVSGIAWGFGYFGGLMSLAIALLFFIQGDITWIHLDKSTYENIRICGPLVAIWFLTFGWPLFMFTPDHPDTGISLIDAIKKGIKSLFKTLASVRRFQEIMKFLIARILYIDALNTTFTFGGIYAAGTFHLSLSRVVLFGITLNIGAGVGAIGFSWLDDYLGSKETILLALLGLIITGTAMLITTSATTFWVFGILLSLCVGPVQSASRSLMVRLSPPELITEMFGLYAFSGKATAFVGPWLLGLLTYLTKSQRIGMSTVIVFFILGFTVLYFVNDKVRYKA